MTCAVLHVPGGAKFVGMYHLSPVTLGGGGRSHIPGDGGLGNSTRNACRSWLSAHEVVCMYHPGDRVICMFTMIVRDPQRPGS